MADRSVRLLISAEMGRFISEMRRGAQAAAGFSNTLGKELQPAFTAIGLAAAAGTGLAIAKFAEFDAAMSNVQASTHETAAVMGEYRQAAIDAGASTVFNATESANAIDELAKAGLASADILGGGLAGSLDLAAAGGLGVARAAEIASTTLQQFELRGSEAGHVADVLAAGAGKAMGSVDDLANGLKFVGPVAASMGVSLEETTGVLALFAQQGILGEQAGTSLRGVLSSLTAPSKEAAREIESLGITLYDSQGNFLGLQNAAGELNRVYDDMDEKSRQASLGVIFGRETVTAATALYKSGAEGVDEWTKAVDDSGYAAETARLKLDNLKGDVEGLGGALDTALIQSGSTANGTLRELVQGATGLVNVFNDAPSGVQGTALALGAATAAAGLATAGFIQFVPKVQAARAAMVEMNLTAGGLAKNIGKGGALLLGLTAITSGLAGMGSQSELTADQLSKLNAALDLDDLDSLDKLFDGGGNGFASAAGGLFDGFNADVNSFDQALEQASSGQGKFVNGFGKFVDGVTFGLTDVSSTSKRFEAQFKSIGNTLATTADSDFGDATDAFGKLVEAAGGGDDAIRKLLEQMPDYEAKLRDLATAQGETLTDQELLNLAIGEGSLAAELAATSSASQAAGLADLSGSAQDAEVSIDDLKEAIDGFGSAQLNVNSATRDFEAAIDDLTQSVEDNGATLDVSEEKGRANQAALDDIAKSTLALSSATLEQTGSQEAASDAIDNGRQRLIEALAQFGITGAAAEEYADKLGLIPGNITTAANLTGVTAAEEALTRLTRPRSVLVAVQATNNSPAGSWTGGIPKATGGPIIGPGTGTSDTAGLYRLSNGEHVMTAREVLAAGGHQAVMAWRKSLVASSSSLPGLAAGGPVYSQQPRYAPQMGPRLVMPTAPTGPRVTVDQNIYPTPGMSEREVARLAVDAINFEARGK